MKFQYEVGMRVCIIDHQEHKGTVTRGDEDGLWFQWDMEAGTQQEHWLEDYEHELMPDTDEARAQYAELTKKVQAKVDEATTLLDQAFKAWFEAASIQAGHEAGNAEAYFLRGNPNLDLSKFEGVVESNGWSTSSLYC